MVERLQRGYDWRAQEAATIAKFLDHSVGVTLSRLSTARGVLCERVGDLDGAAS
jgi:hypothetical protein